MYRTLRGNHPDHSGPSGEAEDVVLLVLQMEGGAASQGPQVLPGAGRGTRAPRSLTARTRVLAPILAQRANGGKGFRELQTTECLGAELQLDSAPTLSGCIQELLTDAWPPLSPGMWPKDSVGEVHEPSWGWKQSLVHFRGLCMSTNKAPAVCRTWGP